MPEGDSIHNLALRFQDSLQGQSVEELSIARHGQVMRARGSTVSSVRAVGKHLLIEFDAGFTLRVHLGMKGRWRSYARGARWSRNKSLASVYIATASSEHACFKAAQTELIPTEKLSHNRALAKVGPDLLAAEVDLEAIVARAREQAPPGLSIAETLLRQDIASGIGNVYKSEVLFLCRVNPFADVGSLSEATLARLYATARELLQKNTGTPGRRNTFNEGRRRYADPRRAPRSWVYGRHHKACLECATPIRVKRHGDHARTTYYCPSCQDSPCTNEPARR